MDIVQELQELGLSKNQAKIYVALLNQARLTVTGLSRVTKISRSSIYSNLTKLEKNDLVVKNNENVCSYYMVTDHANLVALQAKKKKNVIDLASLINEDSHSVCNIPVQIYAKGENGFDKSWDKNIFSTEKIIREMGPYEVWRDYVQNNEKVGSKKHQRKMQEWCDNSVRFRTMNSIRDTNNLLNDPRYPPKYYVESGMSKTWETRLYPGNMHFEASVVVVDEVLKLFFPGKDLSVIFIESSSVARTFKVFFDFLWGQAKANPALTRPFSK